METLTRVNLLKQIKGGYRRMIANYDTQFETWKKSIQPDHAWGYCPFMLPVSCAFAEAFLYHIETNEKMASLAREHLLSMNDFMKYFPENYQKTRPEYETGLPPVGNIFYLWQFAQAYLWLRESPHLSSADHRLLEKMAADSMPFMYAFPEWGAHNRTILRALCMALCAKAFPKNAAAPEWSKMGRIFAGDSLRQWNIEDAMLYHATWMHALLWYVDAAAGAAAAVDDFFDFTNTRYYFEYFKQLLAPSGALADFGDSNWQSNSELYVACFARGARQYRDPELAYAAETVFNRLQALSNPMPYSEALIAAYLWLDDTLEIRKPVNGSGDVLDELVGKKIVFRSGWEHDSTFLLLNYKPETDFGITQREYLKQTLSVEAEKAHHGHSDENSICLLMHNQSVLLHDGGYRETLPNGKYRADYYHNRIVVRNKALTPGTPIMDFLQYDGKHQPVETHKIDFQSFAEVDMSRTRVTDRANGYQWDRCLTYLKQRQWFVIIDGIRLLESTAATRERTTSLSNLFFTRQILQQAANYADTRIDKLQQVDLPDNSRLLVCFPQAGQERFWIGSQSTRRYYQDEMVLHQSLSRSVLPGEIIAFITVLIPHAPNADVEHLARSVSVPHVSRYPGAAAVQIADDAGKITIGVKLDRDAEILKQNIRPRYNWDSGRTVYGEAETDARFIYCRENEGTLSYAFTEAVGLTYRGQPIFRAKPFAFGLQYEGADIQVGVSKWRAWEDRVALA
ncbi:hypothetical protein JXJ21_06670 [candidate division KSB1 bacterium]|nr:hypothetical protein [candidate division KSB1 bacterium]